MTVYIPDGMKLGRAAPTAGLDFEASERLIWVAGTGTGLTGFIGVAQEDATAASEVTLTGGAKEMELEKPKDGFAILASFGGGCGGAAGCSGIAALEFTESPFPASNIMA